MFFMNTRITYKLQYWNLQNHILYDLRKVYNALAMLILKNDTYIQL